MRDSGGVNMIAVLTAWRFWGQASRTLIDELESSRELEVNPKQGCAGRFPLRKLRMPIDKGIRLKEIACSIKFGQINEWESQEIQ